jgi:glutathione S-transferase
MLTIVGRRSSSYTRVARIFALELGVQHDFKPVFDLTTLDEKAYAGNPALKIPVLVDETGPLYGTENVCRELARRADRKVVMRGDSADRLIANAEEMMLHVMSSEVSLIMAKITGAAAPPKVVRSIENCLCYLDENVEEVLRRMPEGLSFFEVSLFCVVTHLPFRNVMDVSAWARLRDFCKRFGERDSARNTEYRFDA